MLKFFLFGAVPLIAVFVHDRVRWHLLQRREQAVLRQKYGDIPMFDDFFRRMGQERRHRAR